MCDLKECHVEMLAWQDGEIDQALVSRGPYNKVFIPSLIFDILYSHLQCLSTNQLEKESGPKYVDLQNRYGWTALMQACCYGHSGAVVFLLQRGVDVQLSNAWKVSSLVVASQGGHFGVVHTLINHGAKVKKRVEG